jgi:hypothetical protein
MPLKSHSIATYFGLKRQFSSRDIRAANENYTRMGHNMAAPKLK